MSSLGFQFKKSSRLLRRHEFKKLQRNSLSVLGRYIVVDYSREVAPTAKIGITVTKKFGKAHERNRFKRLVREAFRLSQKELPHDLQVNVRPRFKAKEASSLLILQELQMLIETALK